MGGIIEEHSCGVYHRLGMTCNAFGIVAVFNIVFVVETMSTDLEDRHTVPLVHSEIENSANEGRRSMFADVDISCSLC
jgi:hypothetical protein